MVQTHAGLGHNLSVYQVNGEANLLFTGGVLIL